MTRNNFDYKLKQLRNDINEMGRLVEDIIAQTADSFGKSDTSSAKSIIENDATINSMEHSIEYECMRLITHQQPIASDLRLITAALKAITDFERVADQCADIAEMILRNGGFTNSTLPISKINSMLKKAQNMFSRALVAQCTLDIELSKGICIDDDEVDNDFVSIINELSSMLTENQALTAQIVDTILIVKYIERIGDHATNIAEWAIYCATGEHPRLN